MTGLKELYEDALDWLSFEEASDDIHWYAWRVVKAGLSPIAQREITLRALC